MGQNSTEVAYNFGQFGSTLLINEDDTLDLSGATAKYYICAITMLADTQFHADGLNVLDGGANMGMGNTYCVTTEDIQVLDDDWGAETALGDNHGEVVITGGSGTVFPKGVTIYGFWDRVQIHAGPCICYVAPRPDYVTRAAQLS
tara:strand:- start:1133 stop:1567 length:435 start_codon:yes stop_codon:yes gene_type:complete